MVTNRDMIPFYSWVVLHDLILFCSRMAHFVLQPKDLSINIMKLRCLDSFLYLNGFIFFSNEIASFRFVLEWLNPVLLPGEFHRMCLQTTHKFNFSKHISVSCLWSRWFWNIVKSYQVVSSFSFKLQRQKWDWTIRFVAAWRLYFTL